MGYHNIQWVTSSHMSKSTWHSWRIEWIKNAHVEAAGMIGWALGLWVCTCEMLTMTKHQNCRCSSNSKYSKASPHKDEGQKRKQRSSPEKIKGKGAADPENSPLTICPSIDGSIPWHSAGSFKATTTFMSQFIEWLPSPELVNPLEPQAWCMASNNVAMSNVCRCSQKLRAAAILIALALCLLPFSIYPHRPHIDLSFFERNSKGQEGQEESTCRYMYAHGTIELADRCIRCTQAEWAIPLSGTSAKLAFFSPSYFCCEIQHMKCNFPPAN